MIHVRVRVGCRCSMLRVRAVLGMRAGGSSGMLCMGVSAGTVHGVTA